MHEVALFLSSSNKCTFAQARSAYTFAQERNLSHQALTDNVKYVTHIIGTVADTIPKCFVSFLCSQLVDMFACARMCEFSFDGAGARAGVRYRDVKVCGRRRVLWIGKYLLYSG